MQKTRVHSRAHTCVHLHFERAICCGFTGLMKGTVFNIVLSLYNTCMLLDWD